MLCVDCFFFGNGCSLFPKLIIKADTNWSNVCKHQRGKPNGETYETTEAKFQQRGVIKTGKKVKFGNR